MGGQSREAQSKEDAGGRQGGGAGSFPGDLVTFQLNLKTHASFPFVLVAASGSDQRATPSEIIRKGRSAKSQEFQNSRLFFQFYKEHLSKLYANFPNTKLYLKI